MQSCRARERARYALQIRWRGAKPVYEQSGIRRRSFATEAGPGDKKKGAADLFSKIALLLATAQC